MREIEKIIIHCSATPPSMDIGAEEIRRWHVDDNGWSDIGYHYVIRRDGTVEPGRPLEKAGAHCRGYNQKSIGICLVGGTAESNGASEFNFTWNQIKELEQKLITLECLYNGVTIHGHNEFSEKACPVFNVQAMFG